MFRGYGVQRNDLSPVYRTTNSEYGWYTPCIHTVPHRFGDYFFFPEIDCN